MPSAPLPDSNRAPVAFRAQPHRPPSGRRDPPPGARLAKRPKACSCLASTENLGKDGAVAISEALNVNASMKKLNVLSNSIGDEGYEMLTQVAEAKGIGSLCGLDESQTEVDLSKQNLKPIDAKLIAWELTTGYVSASLTSIDLSWNDLRKDGAVAVANALHVNASLTELNLNGCSIGKDGAVAIAKSLEVNASLKSIDLSWNQLGKDGAIELAKALHVNASITKLK